MMSNISLNPTTWGGGRFQFSTQDEFRRLSSYIDETPDICVDMTNL